MEDLLQIGLAVATGFVALRIWMRNPMKVWVPDAFAGALFLAAIVLASYVIFPGVRQ